MENIELQNKKLILVVDDEEINRELLGNILQEKYRVEYACDGEEAAKQIRTACYNIGNGIMTVDQAVNAYGTIDSK